MVVFSQVAVYEGMLLYSEATEYLYYNSLI